MTTPLAAKIARAYGTPCAVIDMDRVERNIARIQNACEAAGVANRPHIKTHKSPLLAKMQIAAGASGITCQKLGEAEVMAEAGIDDILISYNLIGDEKMARLGALQRKANMTVAADNSTVIAGLPKAAETSGRQLPVVVECDTGAAASIRRCDRIDLVASGDSTVLAPGTRTPYRRTTRRGGGEYRPDAVEGFAPGAVAAGRARRLHRGDVRRPDRRTGPRRRPVPGAAPPLHRRPARLVPADARPARAARRHPRITARP